MKNIINNLINKLNIHNECVKEEYKHYGLKYF